MGVAGYGLYDYGARPYDAYLGRFLAPDTLVPDPADPQSLNRYSYAVNNALRFTDPTGHRPECGAYAGECGNTDTEPGYQPNNYWCGLPADGEVTENMVQLTLDANKALHRADSSLAGLHNHEIQPVNWGGSPDDPLNKIAVDPTTHLALSKWWEATKRSILGK